ncbi:MAG TPA: helix-turn-helix transcriptional regulator [Solirubrobacterales bacterium]|nr:helix-turn-helix transcriptional regulator [Solirubrobacterales bacterium]
MAAAGKSPAAQFAANVERLREARGMTQEQLGWAAGLHQTAVARIESGERKPILDTIFKLAAGLEVAPAELFDGID